MNWLIRRIPIKEPFDVSWEVGYYAPANAPGLFTWVVYQPFDSVYRDQAEQLVHYLNGGEIPV